MQDSFKINEGWTKYIMREAMSGVLPERIRWRKDKIGFWTPHKLWMNELKEDIECAVDEFKLFDARRYYDDYYKKGKDYQYTLWKIYHLSKWIPMFTGGL
jgi:asparagine synthase (glutamine-hydrolysing)